MEDLGSKIVEHVIDYVEDWLEDSKQDLFLEKLRKALSVLVPDKTICTCNEAEDSVYDDEEDDDEDGEDDDEN